jgi:hypothetical protein
MKVYIRRIKVTESSRRVKAWKDKNHIKDLCLKCLPDKTHK